MRNSQSKTSSIPVAASQRRAYFRPDASWLPPAGLLAAFALAGCATGDISMLVPIAGGTKVQVPFSHGAPVPTEADGVRIESTRAVLDPTKKSLVYTFEFSDAQKRAVRSVKVEDVSDDAISVLVDDASPEIDKGRWLRVSRSLGPDDECLTWIFNLENTVRIFRFTIVFTDGRTAVLNQGAMYPNPLKAAIRHMFGKDY